MTNAKSYAEWSKVSVHKGRIGKVSVFTKRSPKLFAFFVKQMNKTY